MWKDVVGYEPYYEVSLTGLVRSKQRFFLGRGGCLRNKKPKILTQGKTTKGYLAVTLTVGGKEKRIEVHQLVAKAFLGEIPGMEVNHIDGVKTNNGIENLEWVTRSENALHAFRLGLRTSNFVK